MKKQNILRAGLPMAVMLVLPYLAVMWIPGDGGMAAAFLLLYIANPMMAVGVGLHAGRSIKTRWMLPLLLVGAFLLGVWLAFDGGNRDFLVFAACYGALGYAAMLVAWGVGKIRRRAVSAESEPKREQ